MLTKRQLPGVTTVTWALCHASPQLDLNWRVAGTSLLLPPRDCWGTCSAGSSLTLSRRTPKQRKQLVKISVVRKEWAGSFPFPFLKIPGYIRVVAKPEFAPHPSTLGWASPRAVPGQVRSASTDIYRHVQSAQSYVLYLHKMPSMKWNLAIINQGL